LNFKQTFGAEESGFETAEHPFIPPWETFAEEREPALVKE